MNTSEQHITTMRTSMRAFDAVVHEVAGALATFRSDGVAKSVDALRAMAATEKARAALDRAVEKAASFAAIDRRARDYANTGLPLVAGDVIYSDGVDTAAGILEQVNIARVAEQQAADDAEYSQRRLEAAALSGAAIVGLAALAGVLFGAPKAAGIAEPAHESPAVTEPPVGYVTARPAGPVLRAASQLCTNLGRVSDAHELNDLIRQAADLMDASGLIVWISNPADGQILPAFSHGYPPEMIARLPPLARTADNAAATAYRTRQMQIVLARPGSSNGAVVAPVLTADGCIGVLSAEIRGGGEASEGVQALAAIVAAQLAGVLRVTPETHERRATGTGNI